MPQPEEKSFQALKAALAAGCYLWNSAEFYGTPENNSLTLLEHYFAKYPEDADKVVLSIKGAVGETGHKPDSSPEGLKRSVDRCMKLLNGRKKIDIFEAARVDTSVSIESALTYLNEHYVKTGKIGGIGLSEVSAATIQRATKVAKIAAVEVEVSLFSTDIFNNGVAAACAEHNIPVVA